MGIHGNIVAKNKTAGSRMKVISKSLETVLHILDHDKHAVLIYRHCDDDVCESLLGVLNGVCDMMGCMFNDQTLDSLLSLSSIASIGDELDIFLEQSKNDILTVLMKLLCIQIVQNCLSSNNNRWNLWKRDLNCP